MNKRFLFILLILVSSVSMAQKSFWAIGDSKTYENVWVQNLVDSGYVKVNHSMAYTGWQTGSIKDRIDDSLAALDGTPDYILMDLGINDARNDLPQTETRANFDYVLDAIHTALPSTIIFMARVWDRDHTSQRMLVNATIDSIVSERNSYVKYGHDETIWFEGGDNGETMSGDGLHYNAASEIEVTNQWVTILETYESEITNYYVAADGDDTNDGLTISTPWKTLDRVAIATFNPGNTISFKRGDTLYGEISKQGVGYVGTQANPITFNAYGTGAKPVLRGDCSEGTWIADTRKSGVWKKWIGRAYGTQGYECINGTWTVMTDNDRETKWYLSNADSMAAFLLSFTASSYSVTSYTGWDTVYLQTHDGLSPQDSTILFRNNVWSGQWLVIKDLKFYSYKSGLAPYPLCNGIIRSCEFQDNRYISLFLAGHSNDNLVDSCVVDGGGYTGMYSWYSHRNIFRYDTVKSIGLIVRGTSGGEEHAGFGAERDTACVWEYCQMNDCYAGAFDSFYNFNDTIRYSSAIDCPTGYMLNGVGWVLHNSTFTTNGYFMDAGVKVDIGYTYEGNTYLTTGGQTHVYNNTFTGHGTGLWANGCAAGSTILFQYNTVTGSDAQTNLSRLQTVNTTSTYNYFNSPGRWLTGVWPNETTYSSLSDFKTATGYEECSTIDGAGGCAAPPALTTRRFSVFKKQ